MLNKDTKIFFLLPGLYAPLGHAIARKLKEEYGLSHMAAFTVSDWARDFVQGQSEVRYEPHIHDQDIQDKALTVDVDKQRLESIEREYGLPNLWPYILVDRDIIYPFKGHPFYRYGHRVELETIQKLVQTYFEVLTDVFDQVKPDYVIAGPEAGTLGLYIIRSIAHKRTIPTLYLRPTRVSNKVSVAIDPVEAFERIFRAYDNLRTDKQSSPFRAEAEEYIRKFRSEHLLYEGMSARHFQNATTKRGVFAHLPTVARDIKNILQGAFDSLRGKRGIKAVPATYLDDVRGTVRRNFRQFTLRGWKAFSEPRENEEYAFYPLQTEPEAFMLLLGQPYVDQANVIRHIARSLPLGMRLYVKEHPRMFGVRPKSFYKEFLELPNVRLINTDVDSHDLIRGARFVVTITGAVGLEALLLGKPAITLGKVYYNRLEMIRKAHLLSDLPALVRDVLDNYEPDEPALLNFITAIFEGSVSADFRYMWRAPGGFEEIWHHPHLDDLVQLLVTEIQ